MAKKNRKTWILLGMILLAILLFWGGHAQRNDVDTSMAQKYELEKSGAGATADYSKAARRLHLSVDKAIKELGLQTGAVKENDKEVARKSVEGKIRWHVRQVQVTIADDIQLDKIVGTLKNSIKQTGGELLATQPDTFEDAPATRIDLGFKDDLAGEALTITTDKIFIVRSDKNPGQIEKNNNMATKAKMAIIIDDFGYSQEPIAAFATIARPLTLAVLPYKAYSHEAVSRGVSAGHQVMLHLPMEAVSTQEQIESSTITVAMSDETIADTTQKAISSLPGITGVNNHQGSRATGDRRVMKAALKVIKNNSLFFIDSRTNGQSIAYDTAKQMGIRAGVNELFIDNTPDTEAVKNQLRHAAAIALRNGSVTVIGHARLSTAAAVREILPELDEKGIRLVFVSQLIS